METSRAFFEWLKFQREDVISEHIPCILRHFIHPKGPANWGCHFTQVPCIPVRGRNGLKLVPSQSVRRKKIFLDDAGDIGGEVIRNDSSIMLAIHQVMEVKSPILEQLSKLGVRSLRESLEEPEKVICNGKSSPASKEILHQFDRLQSPIFRKTFRKRISSLGVELKLIYHDWQDRLNRIQEIKFGEEINVYYRFHRKQYREKADAGFDARSGIFWVKQGLGERGLYESIAKQLVFKPIAQPIHLFALERAVEMDIAERSFGSPNKTQTGAKQGTDSEDANLENGELGEAGNGHSPFVPDPTRNWPMPKPITDSENGSGRSEGYSAPTNSGEDGSGTRQTPRLEKGHIENLKCSQYASHCQMCLCERSPKELAPTGSYIESEEVRRKVVEAHHADPVSAGGERHAGNIILLCKLHHDNYGAQLTRSEISVALRNNPKKMAVQYGADSLVNGQKIEFEISATGEIVKLFFTERHREYWLKKDSSYV